MKKSVYIFVVTTDNDSITDMQIAATVQYTLHIHFTCTVHAVQLHKGIQCKK